MRHPVIWAAIIVAAGIIIAAVIAAQRPAEGLVGRYQMMTGSSGVLRLDTRTGEIVSCRRTDLQAYYEGRTNHYDCEPKPY
jgi:hypothetical protein